MTTIIHMDTDIVRSVAGQMSQTAEVMRQMVQTLLSNARSMDWSGNNRDEFIDQVEGLGQSIAGNGETCVLLSQRVQNEVTEWEQIGDQFISGQVMINQIKLIRYQVNQQAIRVQWGKMTTNERIVWLQQLHNKIAAKYGLPPIDIRLKQLVDPPGKDAQGVHYNGLGWLAGGIRWLITGEDSKEHVNIDIDNVNQDSPWDVIDTMAHETRHSMQHYYVDHPDKAPSDITPSQIKEWKNNINNYVTPDNDFEGYRRQPIEKDAREFGGRYIDELSYGAI